MATRAHHGTPITAGCVGIISGVASTSKLISQFVRRVRDAKSDLVATAAQLSELEMTIGILQDDFGEETTWRHACPTQFSSRRGAYWEAVTRSSPSSTSFSPNTKADGDGDFSTGP
ncbi:hypothetical protein B0T14DRAFT_251676 [Immersiella caudata]|uniref:Fungal N-terminal domain-containing protein n=1 Tax=Immersiella caudata TaxID=314043 RepID=A0AA39WJW9_9PEZI|nr:hypothetical protein B0T14DRAFT_251676 [Immersiella caudata]